MAAGWDEPAASGTGWDAFLRQQRRWEKPKTGSDVRLFAMRSNNKRTRGRQPAKRPVNPKYMNFDSNGPDVRVRGNALQVYEKYSQLAKDALSDRVKAENYLQHAEHYFRIHQNAVAAEERAREERMAQRAERPARPPRGEAEPQTEDPVKTDAPPSDLSKSLGEGEPAAAEPAEASEAEGGPANDQEADAAAGETGTRRGSRPRRRNTTTRPRRSPRSKAAAEDSEPAGGDDGGSDPVPASA